MAARNKSQQDSELRLECPWCKYSLEGLALDGQCPECCSTYAEWMLRAAGVPRKPTWVKPAVILLGVVWISAFSVFSLTRGGGSDVGFGGMIALVGLVPSLILIVGAAHLIGMFRGPTASGVVTVIGLGGALIGGPGLVLYELNAVGYFDPFVIIWLPIYQVVVTFLATILGLGIGLVIPSTASRKRPPTRSANKSAKPSLAAKLDTVDDAEIIRTARDKERSAQGSDGPEAEHE